MKEFWDERYKGSSYVYGKEPNVYLKRKLSELKAGSILFPAEGEGRNAVFAAGEGWEVSAFDQSSEGRKKALLLAEEEGVELDYQIADFQDHDPEKERFDAVALIFAHFPPQERKDYFQKLVGSLRKGGSLIFEGFGKRQLDYQRSCPSAGGPRELNLLFSEEELKETFSSLELLEFHEGETDLHEGEFHKGKGWVIQFTARKKA